MEGRRGAQAGSGRESLPGLLKLVVVFYFRGRSLGNALEGGMPSDGL